LAAAVEHAVSAHGYRGWQELRLVLRAALKEEAAEQRSLEPSRISQGM
jgi:DNA-binding MurR/RpiR family transcriptional regulator